MNPECNLRPAVCLLWSGDTTSSPQQESLNAVWVWTRVILTCKQINEKLKLFFCGHPVTVLSDWTQSEVESQTDVFWPQLTAPTVNRHLFASVVTARLLCYVTSWRCSDLITAHECYLKVSHRWVVRTETSGDRQNKVFSCCLLEIQILALVSVLPVLNYF